MKKLIIAIILIAFAIASCGSSKHSCDAYGAVETSDTTDIQI